jgi:regulator of PEP synthase PpsR (kinase-PPPase family)
MQLEQQPTPRINIISDSVGDSAATIAVAAASQFTEGNCLIQRLPNATSLQQIAAFVNGLLEASGGEEIVVLYTIADPALRTAMEDYIEQLNLSNGKHFGSSATADASQTNSEKPEDGSRGSGGTGDRRASGKRSRNVAAVDLLGPSIAAIAEATGMRPKGKAGLIRRTDPAYYDRVAAMEFAVDHDDGRNPEELLQADIVLIGASRTSKTPLSIYLAMQGYRVSNIPLALGVEPPKELFQVQRTRIFGLTSQVELLSEIRTQRLGNAIEVAGEYASQQYVQDDLDAARALMRRLGVIVVRTDNRAIEETAREILKYYSQVHGYLPVPV